MDMKIIPPEDINIVELERELDGIETNVNKAIHRSKKQAFFKSNWEKEGDAYKLEMQYSGEGRIKNFLLKKLIKKAMKKLDKRIQIK